MAVTEWLSGRGVQGHATRRAARPWLEDLVRNPWQLAGLIQFALTIYALAMIRWPDQLSLVLATVFAVVAGLFLPPRVLLASFAANLFTLIVVTIAIDNRKPAFLAFLSIQVLLMALLYWVAKHRYRAGVVGIEGEEFITDLRRRLAQQSRLPQLPHDWSAELALAPARGDSFAGDLVVSTINPAENLEVALVDLSGAGRVAGGRALLVSGAVGGLLGAVPVENTLAALNTLLCRKSGDEEFATAAHVELDLTSGHYSIAYAGHPPAVQYFAGTGRWRQVTGSRGPALGIVEGARFPRVEGALGRGDALVLFTDGAIEARDRSLQAGLDKLLGSADRKVTEGFAGLADHLCATAPSAESDDRAVFLVWRR